MNVSVHLLGRSIFFILGALLFQLNITKSSASSNESRYSKFKSLIHFDDILLLTKQETETIRVAVILKEPFFYRNEEVDNKRYEGIEWELLKMIAAKDDLNLSFHVLSNSRPVHQQLIK